MMAACPEKICAPQSWVNDRRRRSRTHMVRFIYHVEPGALPEPLSGFVYTCYYHYCCCLLLSLFLVSRQKPVSSAGNKSRPYKSDRNIMNEMRVGTAKYYGKAASSIYRL